jgi:hypothetical protein
MASGIGAFTPSSATWALRSSASAGPPDVGTFKFGTSVPVVGDWNGDGKDDIGTFNRNTGVWSLRYGTSAGAPDAGVFAFGKPGSLPVVGDWNGDGRDDIGVYVPGTATWSLRLGASAGPADAGTFKFGSKNAMPVAGDWNGDGTDGIGTFDPKSATWTLRQTPTAGTANAGTFKFGAKNTYPVVGDWNGDKRDGIGAVDQKTATWSLRQTATAGIPDAGTFKYGAKNLIPVTGDWIGPPVAPAANTLATVTLKPIDLNLLGLEVQTSPITVTISAKSGDGNILGNLIDSASNLVSTTQATSALNNVLSTAVDLVNSSSLSVDGVTSGTFNTAAPSTTQVLELFVAPIHTDTLGVQVDTSPVRLSISAHAGPGLVLGNAMTTLSNLFNPPLPSQFNIDDINQQLSDVLGQLNAQLGSIPAATVPTKQPTPGDVLNFAIPQLDMNLLGLELVTDPVTFDASGGSADGQMLGNLWTTAMNEIPATPDKMAQLSNTVSGVLARVFGALNASSLTVASGAVNALSPALQTLAIPTLINPTPGATADILDIIPSTPANTPPATVNLLGLNIAGNNLNSQLIAHTGDGQVLGNMLYNVANLANPGASAGMVALLGQLASGSTGPVAPVGATFSPILTTSTPLTTLTLPSLDLNLLGLDVQTGPITLNLTAQSGDGVLLGNVLSGYTSLLNLGGVNHAVSNVLATTANLVNSTSLSFTGVGSGAFDARPVATTPLLDSTVAPIHMNLLGAVVDTGPVHLTMTAHSGPGLILGNALTDLANVFNPPLPSTLDATTINAEIQQLLGNLNAQIPGIASATLPTPPSGDVLNVSVPGLNLNLLGMGLKTDPIFLDGSAHSGNGMLLGNLFSTAFNTLGNTPSELGTISGSVDAVLAKIVGVFNSSSLVLPSSVVSSLPSAYQTLALPTLINPVAGATNSIFDLNLASSSTTPSSAGVLGVTGMTTNIHLGLTAQTGDGQILGNMLYNVSNLLNAGTSSNFLYLLPLLT